MATPEVSVKITADASGFAKGAAIVQGSLAALQKQMTGFQALAAKGLGLIGFTGVAAAATALISATKAATEYGNQLDATSQKTGVAVEDLARLQYAAELSESSAESLAKGLLLLAPKIAAAAAGAPQSAKLFEQFGIAVRNTDGSVRSTYDVFLDLADVFASLPEGTQRAALGVDFFNQKIGAEMGLVLANGKAGLEAIGLEFDKLGRVMTKEQAKAAAEFDDNLGKLAETSKRTAVAVGNFLIPSFNKFLDTLLKTNKESNGFVDFVGNWFEKVKQAVRTANDMKRINSEIANLLEKIKAGNGDQADYSRLEVLNQELIAIKNVEKQNAQSDAERITLATKLAAKIAELEKKRAVAAGEASADILKDDKDLNAARLKDAEKLRDALRDAYQTSAKDAKSAAEEAIKLLDKARSKRTTAADKAVEASTTGLSDDDKLQVLYDQAQSLFDQGRYYAAAAAAANLDKRTKQADAYQKQADEFLARAESFADKSGNQELIGNIADAQARILESQAAVKQQEAAELEQRAAAQMEILNQVEIKIKEMTAAAANFELTADITQLEADIARIKAEIEKGAVMPVTLAPINAGASGVAGTGASGDFGGGATGEFSRGGFTGWLGRSQIAGFVHGREYVTPAGITMQPGVIPFLEALRKYGNKVIPGYQAGGLVTGLRNTAPASRYSGSTVNLSLDGNTYTMSARDDVAAALVDAVRREALRKGGR